MPCWRCLRNAKHDKGLVILIQIPTKIPTADSLVVGSVVVVVTSSIHHSRAAKHAVVAVELARGEVPVINHGYTRALNYCYCHLYSQRFCPSDACSPLRCQRFQRSVVGIRRGSLRTARLLRVNWICRDGTWAGSNDLLWPRVFENFQRMHTIVGNS